LVCLAKGGVSSRKKISLKNDFSGYMVLAANSPLLIFEIAKAPKIFYSGYFSGETFMSGLDNLIAFIDNGGTRSGAERRHLYENEYMPERRVRYDRRSGADRRRILNKKRKQGKERRTVFVD
jgi:hypothetical protein